MYIKHLLPGRRDSAYDLLLLADEDEQMLGRYAELGDMLAMFDEEDDTIVAEAIVVPIEDGVELKNIAVAPEYQHHGLGSRLVSAICAQYSGRVPWIMVGTGDADFANISFYEQNGFRVVGRVPDIFAQYDHPIVVNGLPLRDMVYLRRDLGPAVDNVSSRNKV
ncbi:hypothetical protein FC50_GL000770 [Lacticaseibacillus pantheris DSM 15945 = JCM 12539 = NBRC 106106]|uniref:N-acetyltransferase domain-containing protein n=2 Tax=Lacticaseibacillus pantheris TaxID=171523 RepID=A0A0R1TZ88_9LACO|nr:GNAT family N-acetyltransferase [Lacticaseibacillus pantheris]KRL86521.1 hypothetical protein FC50_GL000770 [Lacticaseibacillus pantheris DSM 15945 = JCM 12539 = NBRC 106106]